MKKITLILSLLISAYGFAQNTSTGVVQLTSDYSVQFDVDSSTDIVTMTIVGPSSLWLGVSFGGCNYAPMGCVGDDAIIYSSAGLSDRYMTGNLQEPSVDSSQDWNLVSNDVVSDIRTIVATRARSTGDSNDFTFPTGYTPIKILWAKDDGTVGYHGGSSTSRGASYASFATLGTSDIISIPEFNIYPNPVTNELSVEFPSAVTQATISVYSVLGTLVYSSTVEQWNSKINTSEWNTGVYLMNINAANFSQTKRIIKQ